MSHPRRRALALATVTAAGFATLAYSQAPPRDPLLAARTRSADQQLAALAQPFVGLRSSRGIAPGLFSIRASGVSTEPVRAAAQAFLDALTPAQSLRTLFAVDDSEWRRWSNVDNGIFVRQGTSLREMTEPQRAAAMALLRASLSAKGLALSTSIMKTDRLLSEINRDTLRYDEQLYFFTMMGRPSPTEPWGWQIDGHHLVINYFVLGDQVVMTPMFLGGEPAVATSGTYAGNAVLQEEQDRGLAFMRALPSALQTAATIRRDKPADDIRAQANQDNLVLEPEGLSAADLPAPLRARLLDLVGHYVSNMREGHARVRMQEVEAQLDNTRFAWVGGTGDDSVFYYRIHSPVILIEFDHQRAVGTRVIDSSGRPTRAHIHVVVRTPNGNDYGKDLLRQHLAAHPH